MIQQTFVRFAGAVAALITVSGIGQASPYTYIDPGYTAEIYAAETSYTYTLGVAFVGNTLWRSDDGGGLYSVDPVNTTTVNGTTVHTTSSRMVVGGAGWFGRGIVGGSDGYLYGNQSGGIRKIDLVAMTSSILPNSVGGAYGIEFLSTGELVYNNGTQVRKYNFGTQTDTLIYSGVNFGDGLSVTPDDHIIVADLGSSTVVVLDSNGTIVNSVNSIHNADGTAYGQGAIFKGNIDGTITRLDFAGPNFTGAATETLIASGVLYHDLATIGPDFSFYLTVLGAHYENGVQAGYSGGSVVRLTKVGGGGFGNDPGVPAPGALALLALGLCGFSASRRARR